jgi:hypothetical protein
MTSPSAFAVLRLTVSVNVVGSCTGSTTPTIKVITAGFYCPRNGVQRLGCKAAILERSCRLWVIFDRSGQSYPASSCLLRHRKQTCPAPHSLSTDPPLPLDANRVNSDNILDIRLRCSYTPKSQSRLVRTPSAEGTLRRRSEGGARERGHTPRSRAAWASVSRHYDRGGRCIPGLGQAKAGNARSDRVPGSLA